MKNQLKLRIFTQDKPPVHRTVIIAGGPAIWDGEKWISERGEDTGRALQWEPKWWAFYPVNNLEAEPENDIEIAFNALKAAMVEDPAYAHSWHANLAMPIYDEGVDIHVANKAATRLMSHLFKVETSAGMLNENP